MSGPTYYVSDGKGKCVHCERKKREHYGPHQSCPVIVCYFRADSAHARKGVRTE